MIRCSLRAERTWSGPRPPWPQLGRDGPVLTDGAPPDLPPPEDCPGEGGSPGMAGGSPGHSAGPPGSAGGSPGRPSIAEHIESRSPHPAGLADRAAVGQDSQRVLDAVHRRPGHRPVRPAAAGRLDRARGARAWRGLHRPPAHRPPCAPGPRPGGWPAGRSPVSSAAAIARKTSRSGIRPGSWSPQSRQGLALILPG